jgi:hypothetical protein
VDADSGWNQMLRSHLPALFLASLQHFAALQPPEGGWRHHWINWWLQAVPLEGEAQVGALPGGCIGVATVAASAVPPRM